MFVPGARIRNLALVLLLIFGFKSRFSLRGQRRRTRPFLESEMIKTLLLALVVMSGCMSMVACNTTEGAGRDMERAGENIQDAARDAKN
jgi:predicted small secreted protein